MLQFGFDEILNFLTDMVKSELFLVPNNEKDVNKMSEDVSFIKNLKKEIRNIKLTNSLMKILENDYENFIIKMKFKMAQFTK